MNSVRLIYFFTNFPFNRWILFVMGRRMIFSTALNNFRRHATRVRWEVFDVADAADQRWKRDTHNIHRKRYIPAWLIQMLFLKKCPYEAIV